MNVRCLKEIRELSGIEKIVLHYKWYLHINEKGLRRDYLILQIEHEYGIVEFGFRPIRLYDKSAIREYLLDFLKKIMQEKSIRRKMKKDGLIVCLYQNIPIYSKSFDNFLRQYLNG